MKYIKFLFLVIIVLAVIILAIQNNEAFATRVVFKINTGMNQYQSTGINIYMISLIAFLLGLIITYIYFIMDRLQMKRRIRTLMNEIKEKDKELNSLRNLPITTDNVLPASQDNHVEMI